MRSLELHKVQGSCSPYYNCLAMLGLSYFIKFLKVCHYEQTVVVIVFRLHVVTSNNLNCTETVK